MKKMVAMVFAMAMSTCVFTAPAMAATVAAAPMACPCGCILSENVKPDGTRVLISNAVAEQNALAAAGVEPYRTRDMRSSFCYSHGHPCYEVTFKSAEGSWNILVDAVNGNMRNIFLKNA